MVRFGRTGRSVRRESVSSLWRSAQRQPFSARVPITVQGWPPSSTQRCAASLSSPWAGWRRSVPSMQRSSSRRSRRTPDAFALELGGDRGEVDARQRRRRPASLGARAGLASSARLGVAVVGEGAQRRLGHRVDRRPGAISSLDVERRRSRRGSSSRCSPTTAAAGARRRARARCQRAPAKRSR